MFKWIFLNFETVNDFYLSSLGSSLNPCNLDSQMRSREWRHASRTSEQKDTSWLLQKTREGKGLAGKEYSKYVQSSSLIPSHSVLCTPMGRNTV